VPRERHQNGWVVESGKRIRKWIGHWCPYRPDGTRTHSTVVLGLKSKMRKWEAEDALRKHIESETGQRPKCDADPTLQWFWENAYLPSRTWGRPWSPLLHQLSTDTYFRSSVRRDWST